MSKRVALIIGNSEYTDGNLSQLKTPDADVRALERVLCDPEIGGFETTTLLNGTVDNTRRYIGRFFGQSGRDDILLLYFSGHGIRDQEGNLFLAASDTEHDLLDATAISASFISRQMDHSRSRRQILILDSCYSGAFARGVKHSSLSSVGTGNAFEGNGYGRFILTATDSMQYAWEGNEIIDVEPKSVFTHHLVKGLETGDADLDKDGLVTIDELYQYVYEQVIVCAGKQTPSKWTYKEQGEFVIAQNPHPVVAEKTPISNDQPKLDQKSLRDLISSNPLEEFIYRKRFLSLFTGSLKEEIMTIYQEGTTNVKIGSCGITPILEIDNSGQQTTVRALGFQVWVFDSRNNQNAEINLGLPRIYKNIKEKERLTGRGKTIRIQLKTRFYKETKHLLLQGTVESFPAILSGIQKNFFRDLLPRLIGRNADLFNDLSIRIRVWDK